MFIEYNAYFITVVVQILLMMPDYDVIQQIFTIPCMAETGLLLYQSQMWVWCLSFLLLKNLTWNFVSYNILCYNKTKS